MNAMHINKSVSYILIYYYFYVRTLYINSKYEIKQRKIYFCGSYRPSTFSIVCRNVTELSFAFYRMNGGTNSHIHLIVIWRDGNSLWESKIISNLFNFINIFKILRKSSEFLKFNLQ